MINNTDGSKTQTYSSRLTQNGFTDFQFVEGSSQSQKDDITERISLKIKEFGIRGSNSESPFAAVLLNTVDQNYFQQNDKALVFVVTDEDDTASIGKLISPKTSDTSRTLTTTVVPGIIVRYSGYAYSGSCTITGENGSSNSGTLTGSIVSQTTEGCRAFVASIPNCNYSCFYTVTNHLRMARALRGKVFH